MDGGDGKPTAKRRHRPGSGAHAEPRKYAERKDLEWEIAPSHGCHTHTLSPYPVDPVSRLGRVSQTSFLSKDFMAEREREKEKGVRGTTTAIDPQRQSKMLERLYA